MNCLREGCYGSFNGNVANIPSEANTVEPHVIATSHDSALLPKFKGELLGTDEVRIN
jgi:hypothetical protein